MIKKLSYTNSLEYVYSTVSLIIIFCLLSLIEVFKNFDIQLFAYRLLNDFSIGLIIGLLFFPLYLLLKYFKESLSIKVIKIIFTLIILVQLGLVGYSLSSHINLGADLIGYNLYDIIHTLKTSLNISFKAVLPLIIVPLVYFGINHLLILSSYKVNPKYLLICLLVFGNISWFLANGNRQINQNKLQFLIADIIREQKDKALANESTTSFKSEYPLEKDATDNNDVLAPFFNHTKEKPNVVIIIVEGLGSDFIDKGEYKGFTPFLDGLINKSLYWENFLSNAGRTFGVIPSLLASLPFGEKGFMELEKYPKHNSLISVLKANGYSTTYYCGADSNFDRKSHFLEYNGIDKIIDIDKFGPQYTMTQKTAAGFSWGYPDGEIYRKTLSEIKDIKKPRLDIIMTLTNHEPFDFPAKNVYLKKVDQILNTKSHFEKNKYSEFKDIFACLLYTDNSIKEFIESYSKRPDYANTIFVITGDHRLIPVPQKDNLCRFHVPLYIYSPMLKKTARFKSVSSHRDVTPSLVSLLTNNYSLKPLEKTTWLGKGLDTVKEFRNTQNIPLMRYKGGLKDYVYKDHFYSDDVLYKFDENFNVTEISDDGIELNSLINSFDDFKKLNAYLTGKDKITRTALGKGKKQAEFNFTPEQLSMIKKITKGLDPDHIFFLARELAFKKERDKARLLCNYILNDLPNYGDVRTLKGRTLAWDGNYKESEKELLEVIDRTPFYTDSYSAIMDLYYWSGQNAKAIKIAKKALANKIDNKEVGFKLAQAYMQANNKAQSRKTIDSLLKLHPTNQDYLSFKKSLR